MLPLICALKVLIKPVSAISLDTSCNWTYVYLSVSHIFLFFPISLSLSLSLSSFDIKKLFLLHFSYTPTRRMDCVILTSIYELFQPQVSPIIQSTRRKRREELSFHSTMKLSICKLLLQIYRQSPTFFIFLKTTF